MERTRLRGWLVLAALIAAAGISSCGRDSPVEVERLLPSDPSLFQVWTPTLPCFIGKAPPSGGSGTWHWTTVPTVDTACTIVVTMTIPPINDLVNLPYERTFGWKHYEPAGNGKSTGYEIGFYNQNLNGPITYTFNQPIGQFAMQLQMIDTSAGHYIKAFNDSGRMVDSLEFGPGAGTYRSDVKTLTGLRIRRVEVHTPLLGPSPNGDYQMRDPVLRQAAFAPDTSCPPPGDSLLAAQGVRDSLFAALDSTLADSNRVEFPLGLYRDSLGNAYGHIGPRSFTHNNTTYSNTQCVSAYLPLPGATLLGTGHSHGLVPPDTTNATCRVYPSGTTVLRGPSGCVNVASPGVTCDHAAAFQTQRPLYVIDRYGVFRITPNMANTAPGSFDRQWGIDRVRRCIL
jgi:hypothetical protein